MNLGLSLALSGHAAQAVATLRPLDPDAGAKPVWRANLAVALALNGNTLCAQHILMAEPAVAQPQAGAPSKARSNATEAPVAQPEAAGAGAWIQLASVPSAQDVAPEWHRLQARFAALWGKVLTVVTGQVNGKTWWRLRIGGFPGLANAEAACRPLLAAGAACLPIAPPQI